MFGLSKAERMAKQMLEEKWIKARIDFINAHDDENAAEMAWMFHCRGRLLYDFDVDAAQEIYDSITEQRKSAEESTAKHDQLHKDIRETAEAVKRIEAALSASISITVDGKRILTP